MSPYEIIAIKRDGKTLSPNQITEFIAAYMRGDVTDYQLTALLMAIYLRGMNFEETGALTKAYINSGVMVDLQDIPGIKVDKHSTGGVGDKVSLILAPLVASLGVPVPMISGRGLGHSGGTLDKLESIPGFKTNLGLDDYRKLLKNHKLALIGQTAEIVPADKRIYALRDVTATVDCMPLIAASIMSKKIAEGIDALVLDVKYGNGAFMKTPEQATELAQTLIRIGKDFSKKTVACLTGMEQPLGNAIGNWLEVKESLECLNGEGPDDLRTVTVRLAAHMLVAGGAADSVEAGEKLAKRALSDGSAMAKFRQITAAQGGDVSFLDNPGKYRQATEIHRLTATTSGYVSQMDTFGIGMTSVSLGAGRLRAEDNIDPVAGILMNVSIGDAVSKGDLLLTIHTNLPGQVEPALERLQNAIYISEKPVTAPPLILKEIV
ncbi:MAG: thymidine phosphorylase [Calditrichia bacterium]